MRLFTAFDIPLHIRDHLAALRQDDLDVRWTPPENMHVTLHFLGDVPDDEVPTVLTALRGVAASSFETSIDGFGVFPSLRKPRVVVASLEESPELLQVHRAVGQALAGIGFEAEKRRYRPHATIGRTKSAPAEQVRSYMASLPEPEADRFKIDDFALYKSTLSPKGARYERLETFSLV